MSIIIVEENIINAITSTQKITKKNKHLGSFESGSRVDHNINLISSKRGRSIEQTNIIYIPLSSK